MNSSELHEAFRTDIGVHSPAALSDDEVWRYMNDAYRNFVRLTGGVADFTTPSVCEVPISAGESVSAISKSILKITRASRASDFGTIQVINYADLGKSSGAAADGWSGGSVTLDDKQGTVQYMMIGMQPNTVRWIRVPAVDDTANLMVLRLPLTNITGDAQALVDVAEQHHIHLLSWMKHLVYLKADPELYDQKRSSQFEQVFMSYCSAAIAEINRAKHKTRVVAYGGI